MLQLKEFLLLWWEIYFPVLTNPSLYKVSLGGTFYFSMFQYFIIYKPFNTLSQFSSTENKQTLAHYCKLAKNIYPVGRLDYDSEGLLILTNDKKLNNLLLNPNYEHRRTYIVQVEGSITPIAIQQLNNGVSINVNGKNYTTKNAEAAIINAPINLPNRNPPIRFRNNIPTSFIQLTLTEGKNRQVRKMTAKTGFPTLRLIRYSIENVSINNMQPGDIIELSQKTIYNKLSIPL